MPRFRHPRALEAVAGHPPSAVHGERRQAAYPVTDGTFEAPESVARRLSESYGVPMDSLRVSEDDDTDGHDAETCAAVKTDGEVCGRELPCPYHDKRTD